MVVSIILPHNINFNGSTSSSITPQLKSQKPGSILVIQDGEQVFFKIKSTTQLKKLMDAYCQRQTLNSSNVRFLFDGQRLHQNQTPKDLNMQNGDEIDVVIQQIGGKL